MIVSALVKRYEDTLDVPFGWQKRAVSYALDIDKQGHLLDVIPLEQTDGKKRVKRTLILPQEPPGRTSGIKAAFLCDNGSYLLGLDDKRGAEKFQAAQELHRQILADSHTPEVTALKTFFDGDPPDITELIDQETAGKAVFVFQVNGVFLDHTNDAVCRAWNEWHTKKSEGEEQSICLITGEKAVPEATHGTISLPGGQTSGSYLISANANSFTSYGKTKDDRAADIGQYAAFAHVTALNALLRDERHKRRIGTDTLVYWAEKGGEAEEALFGDLLSPPKADEEGNLADTVAKIAKGGWVSEYERERKLYLLCLSPNAARISVRFFCESKFGDLIRNIQTHYNHLNIMADNRTPFQFLPVWLILSETTVKKSAVDASPLLGGQLLRCILTGTDYPFTLFHAILTRIRAGEEVSQAKAAVIKAVLIKNYNEREATTVALNEQSTNKPYVLGRLFSVLERLQENANGSATIRERYFTSACANPGSVFPTLLNLSMHHAAKLDNAVFFEKKKGELLSCLDDDTPFPAAFSLDDQGRFILGYYHQRQSFFTKKEKEGEIDNEQ
jgi:CRISPR-associated protein Csd1